MAKKAPEQWQNRIVGYGEEAPEDLLANALNFRIHPKAQQDALLDTINEVGFVDEVIVNRRTNNMVNGHLRVTLAMRTGQASIPVKYIDVSEAEERVILATFDPISALATTDAQKLDELLHEVSTGSAAIQQMLDDMAESAGLYLDKPNGAGGDEFDATPQEGPTRTQLGDLWQLGEHRLLVGDCTVAENVDRLMVGETGQLLLADPPYNVGLEYGNDVDDAKSAEEYGAFAKAWFVLWSGVSSRQVTTPGYYNLASWMRYFEKPYHVAPWTKTNSMTRGHVSRFACWEPVLFYGKGWERERANDVFNFPVSEQRTASGENLTALHPCPKPLAFWLDLLSCFTDNACIVLDPFLGSGTTLIACERLGRKCYGCEIEPKYGDVILRRWEAETGQEAVLLERAANSPTLEEQDDYA